MIRDLALFLVGMAAVVAAGVLLGLALAVLV